MFVCSCYRDKTGKFPEYPSDDEGGSALLFKEKTPEEVEIMEDVSSQRDLLLCELPAFRNHIHTCFDSYMSKPFTFLFLAG